MRKVIPIILLAFFAACSTPESSYDQEGSTPVQETSADDSTIQLPEPKVPDEPPLQSGSEPLAEGSANPEITPVKYLLGQFKPAQDENFVKIAPQYTAKSNIYLHYQTYAAFQEMAAAAELDGIKLRILSATRNFSTQKSIWEAKWTGARKVGGRNLATSVSDPAERALAILTYSSMPGTSRHHWGTDLDLNALENSYFEAGEGRKVYEWMQAHAADYGFCQPYTEKGDARPYGYNEEKWHWSFTPLSEKYLKDYLSQVSYSMIKGFKGSESAEAIKVIPRYVDGINKACK